VYNATIRVFLVVLVKILFILLAQNAYATDVDHVQRKGIAPTKAQLSPQHEVYVSNNFAFEKRQITTFCKKRGETVPEQTTHWIFHIPAYLHIQYPHNMRLTKTRKTADQNPSYISEPLCICSTHPNQPEQYTWLCVDNTQETSHTSVYFGSKQDYNYHSFIDEQSPLSCIHRPTKEQCQHAQSTLQPLITIPGLHTPLETLFWSFSSEYMPEVQIGQNQNTHYILQAIPAVTQGRIALGIHISSHTPPTPSHHLVLKKLIHFPTWIDAPAQQYQSLTPSAVHTESFTITPDLAQLAEIKERAKNPLHYQVAKWTRPFAWKPLPLPNPLPMSPLASLVISKICAFYSQSKFFQTSLQYDHRKLTLSLIHKSTTTRPPYCITVEYDHKYNPTGTMLFTSNTQKECVIISTHDQSITLYSNDKVEAKCSFFKNDGQVHIKVCSVHESGTLKTDLIASEQPAHVMAFFGPIHIGDISNAHARHIPGIQLCCFGHEFAIIFNNGLGTHTQPTLISRDQGHTQYIALLSRGRVIAWQEDYQPLYPMYHYHMDYQYPIITKQYVRQQSHNQQEVYIHSAPNNKILLYHFIYHTSDTSLPHSYTMSIRQEGASCVVDLAHACFAQQIFWHLTNHPSLPQSTCIAGKTAAHVIPQCLPENWHIIQTPYLFQSHATPIASLLNGQNRIMILPFNPCQKFDGSVYIWLNNMLIDIYPAHPTPTLGHSTVLYDPSTSEVQIGPNPHQYNISSRIFWPQCEKDNSSTRSNHIISWGGPTLSMYLKSLVQHYFKAQYNARFFILRWPHSDQQNEHYACACPHPNTAHQCHPAFIKNTYSAKQALCPEALKSKYTLCHIFAAPSDKAPSGHNAHYMQIAYTAPNHLILWIINQDQIAIVSKKISLLPPIHQDGVLTAHPIPLHYQGCTQMLWLLNNGAVLSTEGTATAPSQMQCSFFYYPTGLSSYKEHLFSLTFTLANTENPPQNTPECRTKKIKKECASFE